MKNILTLVISLFLPCIRSWFFDHWFGGSHQMSAITHSDYTRGAIIDELGRSRLFHGVNIVYKAFPYYPKLDEFDVRWSFSKEDVDILSSLGMNAIRLDVSWAAAEPIRGSFNQSYFDVLHRIIDMCASSGIYVLLEWHQDLFSEKYCGNGAPLWASRPLKDSMFGYPFPGKTRAFKIVDSIADPKECEEFHDFAKGYLNAELCEAFRDLYVNYNGIRDSFANFWIKIATEFKDKSNVLGYELFNEPWVGEFYENFALALGVVADRKNIEPLYNVLEKAIRTVDTQKLIFFESVNINLNWVGFSEPPGGFQQANKSVLSWHYYYNPIGKQAYIRSRSGQAKRLQVTSFASEFDISWDGTLRDNLTLDEGGIQVADALNTMQLLDELQVSWLGWEYKTFVRKTGWGDGLFDEATGLMRPKMAKLYSRPFARAIVGTLKSMRYDDRLGIFDLQWTHPLNETRDIESEVFLNSKWHYPNGYQLTIEPPGIVSTRTQDDVLYLKVKSNQTLSMQLRVAPNDLKQRF